MPAKWSRFLEPYLAKNKEDRPALCEITENMDEPFDWEEAGEGTAPDNDSLENKGDGPDKQHAPKWTVETAPKTNSYFFYEMWQHLYLAIYDEKCIVFYVQGQVYAMFSQRLWALVTDYDGTILPDSPANISWDDCEMFVDKLNELCALQLKGKRFSLPTQAQWMFAAKGGIRGRYAYDMKKCVRERFTSRYSLGTPNELGVVGMTDGDWWEWCADSEPSPFPKDSTAYVLPYFMVCHGNSQEKVLYYDYAMGKDRCCGICLRLALNP